MLSYIIYTDKYTYLVRAKRGEKIILYYVYHTTLHFGNHITKPLFLYTITLSDGIHEKRPSL